MLKSIKAGSIDSNSDSQSKNHNIHSLRLIDVKVWKSKESIFFVQKVHFIFFKHGSISHVRFLANS